MLRVGIVAEGSCDWLVLKAMMRQIRPDVEFEDLQPDRTLTSKRSNGWIGVKAWCEELGPQLENLMTSLAKPLHLLVIHLDCSMANWVGADRPCPPCVDTANALTTLIEESWLKRVPRPPFVVLALPSMTTDTWVVATLDPPYPNLAELECDRAAEDQLAKPLWGSIKRLSWDNGQIRKRSKTYAPFADRVGSNLALVKTRCPQARVFCEDFERAAIIVAP